MEKKTTKYFVYVISKIDFTNHIIEFWQIGLTHANTKIICKVIPGTLSIKTAEIKNY
jgi:hypothetical protein